MHAITKLRRDIESSRRRMLVALSPNAEKLAQPTTELAEKRKRRREQQEALKINDRKELFEEKL